MYKMVKAFTPDMATKDFCVFMRTNFQEEYARGKFRLTDDNFVYALFPNRKYSAKERACEMYVKPEGEIHTWKDKLHKDRAMELDALDVDVPATWEEYSDLLCKLTIDHTLDNGVIVIEDAETWRKLSSARKRLLRKEQAAILGDDGGVDNPKGVDNRIYDTPIYPLAL